MNTPPEITELLARVRVTLVGLGLPNTSFDENWRQVTASFLRWLNKLPAAISPLTRNLELLRRLCETFDIPALRHNQDLLSVLLQGAIEDGQSVNLHGGPWKVVRRTVTERYGILYTLQNEKGEIIEHEFFD